MMPKASHPKGSDILDQWAHPCELSGELLAQRTLRYDAERFEFVRAASALFGLDDGEPMGDLHLSPIRATLEDTPPALRRAQIQAQLGPKVTKEERKDARNHAVRWDKREEWLAFMEVYRRFIHEWVVPQCGDEPLLYQRKPILRVVMPGSVAPTQMHVDADYFHDANEINFWVPLTSVWGSNSLWSESSPGLGDFAPFVAGPGEAIRFYGNRCRHYTLPNDEVGTRVSIDFRVVPLSLFKAPQPIAAKLSRHALNPGTSKRGYYALAEPAAHANGEGNRGDGGLSLGALRRSWRSAEPRMQSTAPCESALARAAPDDDVICVIESLFGIESSRRAFARQDTSVSEVHARFGATTTRAKELTYGEFDLAGFLSLLQVANPRGGETFIDLGSGCGRLVLAAALSHRWEQANGVELLESLHQSAIGARDRLVSAIHGQPGVALAPCEFICAEADDVLPALLSALPSTAVVFVYATCWPGVGPYLPQLTAMLAEHLPIGSRVITVDKQLVEAEDQRWRFDRCFDESLANYNTGRSDAFVYRLAWSKAQEGVGGSTRPAVGGRGEAQAGAPRETAGEDAQPWGRDEQSAPRMVD